jgi:glycosyltransferase involved in cell wall biosynthesis
MEQDKICFLRTYASHYRASLNKLISENINSDFYFGDDKHSSIKKIDFDQLSNFKREFKRINLFGNLYWLKGSVSSFYKKYNTLVLPGEPYCLSTWILLLYSRLFNVKIYLWTHGWYGRESKIKKVVKKMFFNLSDGIFLYGDYARALMIKEGFAEDKLTAIYNSLDYEKHIGIRRKLKSTDIYSSHFKNNYPTLIYVGRIQKMKRIDMIFDAMEKLNEQGVHVNFVVVGDNTDIDLSTDISINDSLKNHIWLYGPCYDETKLGELFYNAAVCVSPGNVGLTAIHSLSFGTPVITHNNFPYQGPEFEAIVEGETGSFFEQNNVDDLTAKIIKILNISQEEKQFIRRQCFKIIDDKYNPYFQLSVLRQFFNDSFIDSI